MAKGKYAGIIDTLPRSFGESPDYQAKINAVKLAILQQENQHGLELTSEGSEEYTLQITAMLDVLNDHLIKAVNGDRYATKLAAAYADVRKVKNALETQEKKTNLILAAYEQLVVDQFEAEGTSTIKFDSGGNVRVDTAPHAVVKDKEANRKWAMSNGLENSLSLPWQTVNALTKEALLRGEVLPDGVEAEARPKVVFTKG